MKYGDTLRQRSIPEWGHYNIDYDYLKELIKHHTTPGDGTALSIPGQGAQLERAFGETFFLVLRGQHDRINLFVKSKSGEIERRLDYIGKQLAQFQARTKSTGSAPLPAKTVERYAKVDNDIAKAGEEIRSLSRFRAAQCTAFHKILKKYKKWTKDRSVERRFKDEVASNPDSFYQLDLGYLLDQYIDVLGTLRATLEGTGGSSPQRNVDPPSPSSRLHTAAENGSPGDFDVALSTIPLGTRGSRATYWVHPDHIVELEILLLQQHMRVNTIITANATNASNAPPLRAKPSFGTADRYLGSEDDAGLIVLDHPDAFAQKQNTSTIDEETVGSISAKGAGNVWWNSSSQAAVVVDLDSGRENTDIPKAAKVKRKQLEAFLNPSSTSSGRGNITPSEASNQDGIEDNKAAVRSWLAGHKGIKPIASICSKRTRFVGLHNGFSGGVWATLDRDILMKDSLPQNLHINEGRPEDPTGWSLFPHAVLEVRREGTQSAGLINTLDRCHLVERVRGFSMETHAVWTCCRPSSMLQPTWIPLLKQDIRKLPKPVERRQRKETTTTGSSSHLSPSHTSTSVTSAASPYPSHHESTSASEFINPPSLRDFRKKRRNYSDQLEAQPQRYWNEYDDPESGDEGGYYIYIDPNVSVKFPGQEVLEAWVRKTRELFHLGNGDEESGLMSSTEVGSSDDETVDTHLNGSSSNYGTMTADANSRGRGYLSNLFGSTRGQNGDIEALSTVRRDRQSLLGEIQARQHEREMTAFQLYTSCLGAAAVLDIILTILTTSSRKKLRGEVDRVVVFGVGCNFLLLLVALMSLMSRKERLGWIHWGLVFFIAMAMVVADALLLRWAL